MTLRIFPTLLGAIGVLTFVGATCGSTSAATQKGIAKCSRAIITAGASFAQAHAKILRKCEEVELRGGTCNLAKRDGDLLKRQAKLRSTIVKACGGKDKRCDVLDADGTQPTLQEIGWDIQQCNSFAEGTCADAITDCDDIPTCIECVGRGSAGQAITLSYDALVVSDPKAEKALNRCQVSLGKATTAFFVAKSKALAKCWTKVNAGKATSPCPVPGDGKAAGAIAKAALKSRQAVCKACGGGDKSCNGVGDLTPQDIGFPMQCPEVTVPNGAQCGGAVTTLAHLVDCLDCVNAFAVDCADRIATLSVGATYPLDCQASIKVTVDGVLGGTDRPLLNPDEAVFVDGDAPIPSMQAQPQIVNLALRSTAVEASTRRLSVQAPAILEAGTARAALSSSLIVRVAGQRGFYSLPLSANKALVGIRFPKFGNLTKIPRGVFGGLTKIPLRLATRTRRGNARDGDEISEYVSLDLDAVGAQTGLEFVQFLPIAFLVDGFTISNDDRHLYMGTGDDLTVLARDTTTGSVSIVEREPSPAVADVAVSPDGATVYAVTNISESAVEVFSRDETTGALTFLEKFTDNVGGVVGINGAVGVLVSPDGRTVYVSGHQASAVAIFQRNLSSGRLTYVGFVSLGGITGQGGAFRASMTRDGRFLYVPNFNNALVVFERDSKTGDLTPIQTIFGDTNGVSGIEGGFNAELTSDETTLYVAGFTKGTVAVFSRDPNSGLLSFQQSAQEIYRTFSVAPSLSGDVVYATTGESLAIFGRDGLGRLSLQGEVRNGDDNVVGLLGSRDILLSGDGRHVYVADFGGEGGLTVFRVAP